MKKKLLQTLSLGLAIVTVAVNSLSAFAYDLDENRNSIESVEYQESANEDFTNVTNVFAELKSEYKITIPKTIVLSGAKKAANYFVKVVGDIAGYEAIKVVPDKNFDLHTKNKDPYTAKVEQDRTIWYVDDLETDGNGLVSADNLSAGTWQGVFYFNIDFVNQLEEKVFGDIILDKDLDADYRLILSRLNLAGVYDNKGNILATEKELFEKGYNPQANDGSAASVINKYYPQAEYVSLSDEITSIGDNAFKGTNVKYVYIPSTVTSIGSKAFADSKIVSANIPSSVTSVSHDAFSNTPANNTANSKNQNTNTYYGNKISRTININLEDNDEAIIELERGYRYQITALYNFRDNVTKQSTIKISDENIIKFVPEYYIDAIDDGDAIISGIYKTKSGLQKNASIKVRVKHTHIKGETVVENYTDSTCAKNGSYDEIIYCVLCNKELSRNTKNIALKSHAYDSGKITTQPKCLTTGIKTYTCTRCGDTKTEAVVKLGHNFVNDVCTRCGQIKVYDAGIYDANWNLIRTWNNILDSKSDFKTVMESDLHAGYQGNFYTMGYNAYNSNLSNKNYKLVVGATVNRIGGCAMCDTCFYEIILPDTIGSIGEWGIAGNKFLEKLTIPSSVSYISNNALRNNPKLTTIVYRGVTYTNKAKFNAKIKADGVAKVNIWD